MTDGELDGAPEEIRTPDPQIRSLVLYPAELRARFGAGLEKYRPPRRPPTRAIAISLGARWQAAAPARPVGKCAYDV
jgi:hypothetical protein